MGYSIFGGLEKLCFKELDFESDQRALGTVNLKTSIFILLDNGSIKTSFFLFFLFIDAQFELRKSHFVLCIYNFLVYWKNHKLKNKINMVIWF